MSQCDMSVRNVSPRTLTPCSSKRLQFIQELFGIVHSIFLCGLSGCWALFRLMKLLLNLLACLRSGVPLPSIAFCVFVALPQKVGSNAHNFFLCTSTCLLQSYSNLLTKTTVTAWLQSFWKFGPTLEEVTIFKSYCCCILPFLQAVHNDMDMPCMQPVLLQLWFLLESCQFPSW